MPLVNFSRNPVNGQTNKGQWRLHYPHDGGNLRLHSNGLFGIAALMLDYRGQNKHQQQWVILEQVV